MFIGFFFEYIVECIVEDEDAQDNILFRVGELSRASR